MQDKQILVVEDEQRVADLLRDYLQQDGFQVHCLYTGGGVVEWVREHQPDLILLDQMLPERDGLSILRQLRTEASVPVIMATARSEEIDRLLGLESGADDYVCKPYSFREVVARVKAVLRRQASPTPDAGQQQPPLVLNKATCSATLLGQEISLTVIEFRMLEALLRRPGQILSRDQLMDLIYSDGRIVSDRTIDSHVRKLRAKLTLGDSQHSPISSVYSAGYKLDPGIITEQQR